jgi:hypothetical protein
MHDRVKSIELMRREAGPGMSIVGWIEGPLALAAELRGLNTIMLDFGDDPEFARDLLRFCADVALAYAPAQIAAGADTMGMSDAAAGLIGGLFGGNARKKKREAEARALAEDAAAFADDLVARSLSAAGDEIGILKLRQNAELEAARKRFGANSRSVQQLLDVQKKELDKALAAESSSDFAPGTYLAPSGFSANPYRFAAGRPPVASMSSTVTIGEITVAMPQGSATQQVDEFIRELSRRATSQGLLPTDWSQVNVT